MKPPSHVANIKAAQSKDCAGLHGEGKEGGKKDVLYEEWPQD